MRHPLSEVCPALTASTTMRMARMTTGALSIMMLCPECVSVMCTASGTSTASWFWAARFGSKADFCTVRGHVRFTPKSGH
jgi:hypothetical protein